MIMLQWVNEGKICNYDAKFKVLDNGLVVLREREGKRTTWNAHSSRIKLNKKPQKRGEREKSRCLHNNNSNDLRSA